MREQSRGNRVQGSAFPRRHESAWLRSGGPLIILFAAFIAVVPQLIRGNSCGHDFDVHLASWLDCINSWRHGIVYPHWASSPNYGAGEPRFVYYPPLTWMLAAALGVLLPWHLVPIALTVLILAATGLATRALALEALDNIPATLAGCASLFSLYSLFTAYERSAFPESVGGACLPLLLLFVVRDRHPSASVLRRAFDGSTAPLALALAAAWISNLPLGVMAGYLLTGTAVIWAVVRKSLAPLLRAAVGIALGLGLAAMYWLPAAWERNWVDIRQATQDPGYNYQNNWLFAHSGNAILSLHHAVLDQASWIAVSMTALAVIGLIACWRRGTLPVQKDTAFSPFWIPLAVIPIVIFFMLCPISQPVWRLLPEMGFLQFPWRWLEAVEAPMAILIVAAIWPRSRRGRAWVVAGCSAAFLAATAFAGAFFFQVCYPEDTVNSVLADFRTGAGFEGMYEYEPPGGDDSNIARGLPDACLVSDPSIVLGQPDPDDSTANPIWSPDQKTCESTFAFAGGADANPEHRQIHATISRAGYLILRLVRFPAWRISVNGKPIGNPSQRGDGLIAVPAPQGLVDLAIDWTITPDVIYGRWATVLSILLLVALCLLEQRIKGRRLT